MKKISAAFLAVLLAAPAFAGTQQQPIPVPVPVPTPAQPDQPSQGGEQDQPSQSGDQAQQSDDQCNTGETGPAVAYDATHTDSIAFHAIKLANQALIKISERAVFHKLSHEARSAANETIKNHTKSNLALIPLAAKVDEVHYFGTPAALETFHSSVKGAYSVVKDSSRHDFEENYVEARNNINRDLVSVLVELRSSGFYDGAIASFVNKTIELASAESGI